ncbi:MAG TPA: hypothetical protein VNX01_11670 [Bacteroidia bacterium]|nr:hypothetical protein [Bacteroidia bacterium]
MIKLKQGIAFHFNRCSFFFSLPLFNNIVDMGELYFAISRHLGGQIFVGVVRAHSIGLNIEYHNDEPIQVEITNINPDTANDLVSQVVLLGVQSTRPVRGVLKNIIRHEAAQIYIRV